MTYTYTTIYINNRLRDCLSGCSCCFNQRPVSGGLRSCCCSHINSSPHYYAVRGRRTGSTNSGVYRAPLSEEPRDNWTLPLQGKHAFFPTCQRSHIVSCAKARRAHRVPLFSSNTVSSASLRPRCRLEIASPLAFLVHVSTAGSLVAVRSCSAHTRAGTLANPTPQRARSCHPSLRSINVFFLWWPFD